MRKNKEVSFKFEKKEYRVTIEKVAVYPQGYGAIVKQMPEFSQKELVVDIGSWTVDLLPIVNHSPDESMCVTTPDGIITCMRRINEQCVRQLNGEVDEYMIQEVMMTGTAKIDDAYLEIIKKEIEDYVQRIIRMIGEQGYNLKTIPITFVGGGAGIVKRFGNINQKNISYLEEIRLRYDVPEQAELINVLANLNKRVHGSVNQFFIDAAQYYMAHFTEEELVTKDAVKHNPREIMTREAYEADRCVLKQEIKTELYEEMLKTFGMNTFMSNIGTNTPVQPIAERGMVYQDTAKDDMVLDEVMADMMSWTDDDD